MARLSVLFFLSFLLATCMTVVSLPILDIRAEEEARDLEPRAKRTGRATFFNVGLGNCGKRSKNSEPVVAMGKRFYDRNKASNCGQWVEIIHKTTRKKAYGQLWDSCPGCNDNQIDLSPSLFQKFATLDKGIFQAEWQFMPKGWKP